MVRVWSVVLRGSLLGSVVGCLVLGPGALAAPAWADTDPALPGATPLEDWATFDDIPLESVHGADVDSNGSAIVADRDANVVFTVDPVGNTTVLAGTGSQGTPDDGEPAAEQRLSRPSDVAAATPDTTFITDDSGAIYEVSDGQIDTLVPAGELAATGDDLSLAADDTTLYVGTREGRVLRIDPDSPDDDHTVATVDGAVEGLDVGPDGDLYAATGASVLRIQDRSVSESLYPTPGWRDAVLVVERDTVALDVAVSDDGTVYAVGQSGLIVIEESREPFVRPGLTGEVVAHGLRDGPLVSTVDNAFVVDSDHEARPAVSSAPGEFDLSGLDTEPAPGTLLSIHDDHEGSVTSMAVSPTGTLIPIGSQGRMELDEPGASAFWDGMAVSAWAGSASVVTGGPAWQFVLSDGTLTQLHPDGTAQNVYPGVSLAALEAEGSVPAPRHLAASDSQLFFASDRMVYTLTQDGLLEPFSTLAVSDSGEMLAFAAAPDASAVYAAVDTNSGIEVVEVTTTSRTTLFTSGDVSGAFRPSGMAAGTNGTLYLTDQAAGRVLRHTGEGGPDVIAGDGDDVATSYTPVPAAEATLVSPTAPALDGAGTLFFTDGTGIYAITAAEEAARTGTYPFGAMSVALILTLAAAAGVLYRVRSRLSAAG